MCDKYHFRPWTQEERAEAIRFIQWRQRKNQQTPTPFLELYKKTDEELDKLAKEETR